MAEKIEIVLKNSQIIISRVRKRNVKDIFNLGLGEMNSTFLEKVKVDFSYIVRESLVKICFVVSFM